MKRLAMHVEDHPFEYGTFEGVIPSGYGAGIVMLWDQGTWEPEVGTSMPRSEEGGPEAAPERREAQRTSWALVRTRTAGERSWLLIKHRDEWAGPLDIAEFAPLSVKTGGDFADILAQENPAIWESHRPAQGGDAGAMFARIIERALAIKAERESAPAKPAPAAKKVKTAGSAKKKTVAARTPKKPTRTRRSTS